MRSLITLCNINRRVSPLVQVTARLTKVFIPSGASEGVATQVSATAALPVHMTGRGAAIRLIGSGAVLAEGDRLGKSFSYQLIGDELLVELSIMKQHPGKAPLRRHLYLQAVPNAEAATVRMRVGPTMVNIAKGPFRVLTSREAKASFLNAFKAPLVLMPEDHRALGLEIQTQQVQESVKAVSTVNELGQETRITVRRRMRAVEV